MPANRSTRNSFPVDQVNRHRPAALPAAAIAAVSLFLAVPPASGEDKPKPQAKPPAAAPAKAPAKPTPAAGAAKSEPKETPLSFTDDDLEKYRKPQPLSDDTSDEFDDGEEDTAAETAVAPGAGQAPAAPKPAPARPVVKPAPRPNPVLGPPPTEDPLRKWKQQSALDGLRQQQIATLRERISGLKSRLEYLNTKKDGLLNPGPPQVAKTRGNEYPPPEPPDPNKPPPPPNYKPDISPGRTMQPVGLIFPSLPEPQTDQDREDDKSMKIKDLLDKVKAEIETVEADLKRAQDDLITIETRAASESAAP